MALTAIVTRPDVRGAKNAANLLREEKINSHAYRKGLSSNYLSALQN